MIGRVFRDSHVAQSRMNASNDGTTPPIYYSPVGLAYGLGVQLKASIPRPWESDSSKQRSRVWSRTQTDSGFVVDLSG